MLTTAQHQHCPPSTTSGVTRPTPSVGNLPAVNYSGGVKKRKTVATTLAHQYFIMATSAANLMVGELLHQIALDVASYPLGPALSGVIARVILENSISQEAAMTMSGYIHAAIPYIFDRLLIPEPKTLKIATEAAKAVKYYDIHDMSREKEQALIFEVAVLAVVYILTIRGDPRVQDLVRQPFYYSYDAIEAAYADAPDYPTDDLSSNGSTEEKRKLLQYVNFMKVALALISNPRGKKEFLLDLITRTAEHCRPRKYSTGSGQNNFVHRRIAIYRHESGCPKPTRPPRKGERKKELQTLLADDSIPAEHFGSAMAEAFEDSLYPYTSTSSLHPPGPGQPQTQLQYQCQQQQQQPYPLQVHHYRQDTESGYRLNATEMWDPRSQFMARTVAVQRKNAPPSAVAANNNRGAAIGYQNKDDVEFVDVGRLLNISHREVPASSMPAPLPLLTLPEARNSSSSNNNGGWPVTATASAAATYLPPLGIAARGQQGDDGEGADGDADGGSMLLSCFSDIANDYGANVDQLTKADPNTASASQQQLQQQFRVATATTPSALPIQTIAALSPMFSGFAASAGSSSAAPLGLEAPTLVRSVSVSRLISQDAADMALLAHCDQDFFAMDSHLLDCLAQHSLLDPEAGSPRVTVEMLFAAASPLNFNFNVPAVVAKHPPPAPAVPPAPPVFRVAEAPIEALANEINRCRDFANFSMFSFGNSTSWLDGNGGGSSEEPPTKVQRTHTTAAGSADQEQEGESESAEPLSDDQNQDQSKGSNWLDNF